MTTSETYAKCFTQSTTFAKIFFEAFCRIAHGLKTESVVGLHAIKYLQKCSGRGHRSQNMLLGGLQNIFCKYFNKKKTFLQML